MVREVFYKIPDPQNDMIIIDDTCAVMVLSRSSSYTLCKQAWRLDSNRSSCFSEHRDVTRADES